jgi:hypothetical protein
VTGLRQARLLLPIAAGALAATVIAAILVARHERSSAEIAAVAQEIARANPNVPPEIAALNAQLAQIAALRAGATYGSGLTTVVRAPVPSLRPTLGEEWRELGQAPGHARLHPSGTPSRYFQVGTVVVAHAPARLVLHADRGQTAVTRVGTKPFEVVNFGPVLASGKGPVNVTLTSQRPEHDAAGPNLVLSPLQAEYRQAGEWVTVMPALAPMGPSGLRGAYLPSGSTTRFAMTPGVSGRCVVAVQGAASGAAASVTVTVGGHARSASIGSRPSTVDVGPFPQGAAIVTVKVGATASSSKSGLWVREIRLIPTGSLR